MKPYAVRLHGTPIKFFDSKDEAKKWMVDFLILQTEQAVALDYLNEAVDRSNMNEAKEVIQYIMEKK
jgi:hypothetical protein